MAGALLGDRRIAGIECGFEHGHFGGVEGQLREPGGLETFAHELGLISAWRQEGETERSRGIRHGRAPFAGGSIP